MTKPGRRGRIALAAGTLALSALSSFAAAVPAGAAVSGAAASAATVSATAVSAKAAAARPAADPVPPRRERIKVLTAVLNNMRRHYRKYAFQSPGPQDIFDYQIGALWKHGIDGAGTTIAVIEGWDDPNIRGVIRNFDKIYGLPDPHITTIFPSDHGHLPASCPPGMVRLGSYGSCGAWEGELELDVMSAHLIAPYARILISATPADSEITDDAASQVAPPEMMRAVEYISRHHLASVISISDGTGESTYSYGKDEITAQDPGELAAAAAGIPLTVATGDCGAAQNLAVANGQCEDTTRSRSTAAWDDSPWVTAVGGSVPNFSASGKRLGPDPVWNLGGEFSGGAGLSAVFGRPGYQNGVKSVTRSAMRSVPDITMDAQDGTSEASPLFAGVLDLAAQLNHGNVGPVNPVLYGVLGPREARDGIADVIRGNDSVVRHGKVVIKGYTAHKGFDIATGWGTVNASRLVPSLVAATRADHQERAARRRAAAALARLEHSIRLFRKVIGSGQSATMTDGGYLPRHPVGLLIDGRRIVILHASTHGSVSYTINPAALHLAAGRHTLTLTSMLLTATAGFRTR
ncbi:MAG: hypothetical protein ACLPUO_25790 [Streptosporangiaceae bacterium]